MILASYCRRAELRLSHWQARLSVGQRIPATVNTVLITEWAELAETQIYPFHFYRRRLREQRGIAFVELRVQDFLLAPKGFTGGGSASAIQHVFVQPPLGVNSELAERLLEAVRATFPMAAITYMDWFAPADVRLAMVVDPYISRYVKKQTLREWDRHASEWIGDSNLSDYYNRTVGIDAPTVRYSLPAGFDKKVVLGSNFAFSPLLVDFFLRDTPELKKQRSIDLHARLATRGVPWYQRMREEAQAAIDEIQGISIRSRGRVRRHKFYAELGDSKLCFSPFGYGEVCWRDYEAYATGALLLKPSMEHLRTSPHSFVPGQTYVPLRWDLSDLEEKIRHYLTHTEERLAITESAFALHRDYIREDRPYADMQAYFA